MRGARLKNVADWLDAGSDRVRVVDPQRKSVYVYTTDGSLSVLRSDDKLVDEELLPGFALWLKGIFSLDE